MQRIIFWLFTIIGLNLFSQPNEQPITLEPRRFCCTLTSSGNDDLESIINGLTKTKDINLVLNALKMQETSWNNGDINGFMDYYWRSDSLKFIGSKGVTYGWQKTLDNYIKGYPDKKAMGTLKFTIIESTQLSNNSIYVIGKWELEKEKPAGGHFTLLWRKIDGKWVIVADHTS